MIYTLFYNYVIYMQIYVYFGHITHVFIQCLTRLCIYQLFLSLH